MGMKRLIAGLTGLTLSFLMGFSVSAQETESIKGAWVNGLDERIIISGSGQTLSLEIEDRCYFANVELDGDRIDIKPAAPELFCFPIATGVSGSLDAIRAAFSAARHVERDSAMLTFMNEKREVVAVFDQLQG